MSRCRELVPGFRCALLLRCRSRLRPRRHRDVDRRTTDQDRRQSAASGEPRLNRCFRRSDDPVAVRSGPLEGAATAAADIPDWSAFEAALQARLERSARASGRGPRPFHGRVTSPTLIARSVHCESPCRKRNGIATNRWRMMHRAGATLAFGRNSSGCRALRMRGVRLAGCRPDRARSSQIRFARDITGARQSHLPRDESLHLCRRTGLDARPARLPTIG